MKDILLVEGEELKPTINVNVSETVARIG